MWKKNKNQKVCQPIIGWVFLLLTVVMLAGCRRNETENITSLPDSNPIVISSTNQPEYSSILKVVIVESGLYEISSSHLEKIVPGWGSVAPDNFSLRLRGRAQPLWYIVENGSFRLRFFGIQTDSRYSLENTYLLSVQPDMSPAMAEKKLDDIQASPVSSYPYTIHFEKNEIYSPQMEEGDHFLGTMMPANTQYSYEFELPQLTDGDGRIKVSLWGSTASYQNPDHHLRLFVNSQLLYDEYWDGAGKQWLEAEIPIGLLSNERNTITFEIPGDTGAAAEINYLDWIQIQYPRRAEAHDDRLFFTMPDDSNGAPLLMTKFSGDVSIIDVTMSDAPIRIIGLSSKEDVVFPGEPGHNYLAVGPKGFSFPQSISLAVTGPNLRSVELSYNYVAIGPQSLLQPLQPLLEWRASQGLQVLSVPIEAVYDQFNDGMPEPEAIQKFLVYASESWKKPPRYLLLIGDATYDPRGYVSSPEANQLSAMFIQTSYGGETVSDVLLGDLNADLRPDLAIGRVPAQNIDQVKIFVEKTLSYEQQTNGSDWRTRILAIADGQESSFRSDAENFLAHVTSPYTGQLYSPEAGANDAAQTVQEKFQEGFGLISYFGHGSISMWGKDAIYKVDNVAGLFNQEKLPVVIQMTCLTGFYIHPKVNSLTESLLWHDTGGAVAVIAPTSLTLQSNQSYLSQAFIEEYISTPPQTLGEVFYRAQNAVPIDNPGVQEVLLTYILFGDPALQVR